MVDVAVTVKVPLPTNHKSVSVPAVKEANFVASFPVTRLSGQAST